MMLRNVGVKRENFVVAAFSAHKGKVKTIWKEVKWGDSLRGILNFCTADVVQAGDLFLFYAVQN